MSNNADLKDLLPHRGRMRLVEDVPTVNDEVCVSECLVRRSWPLCEDGQVSSVVLIELVAQTAAAQQGHAHRHEPDFQNRGFLVGVKTATWKVPRIPCGTRLRVTVTLELRHANYAAFRGHIDAINGDALVVPVADITIQAFRP